MVRGPTHISGITLDPLITNSDYTTYMTSPKSFSDNYPIRFFTTVDYLPVDDVTTSFYESFRLWDTQF